MNKEPLFQINDLVHYSPGPTGFCRITQIYPNHGGSGKHYYYGQQYFGGHVAFYDPFLNEQVKKELFAAREKFPNTEHVLAALTEEVGELAQAMLNEKYKEGGPEEVLKEAIQVAAMAFRLATESDTTFPYKLSIEKILEITKD